LSYARGLTLDHVIVKNTPHTGNADEGGIDFEDDNENVTIMNSVFINNAGPAIEFLRGGSTLTASSNVEIKNSKFIRNNWAHTNTDPSEIQVYDWQIWKIVDAGGGYYRIVNELHPFVVLQDAGGIFYNIPGTHNVALTPVGWNLPEQLWSITEDGTGHYKIVNKQNPNVALQDAGGIYENIPGTHNVALTPTSWNIPEQKWSLVRP